MDNPDQHPPTSNSSSLMEPDGQMPAYVRRHFRATLQHIKERKERNNSEGPSYADVDLGPEL